MSGFLYLKGSNIFIKEVLKLVLSNQTVYLAEQYAYDAWGNRRTPSDWSLADNRTDLLIDRGYTMHEHITGFDLINMFRPEGEHEQVLRVTFGRVYDAALGSFLSADPIIQAPHYTQDLNLYSYAYGNPLKYTDPSGYSEAHAAPLPRDDERRIRVPSGGMNWRPLRLKYSIGRNFNNGRTYMRGTHGGAYVDNNSIATFSGEAFKTVLLYASAIGYAKALASTMSEIRVSVSFKNGAVFNITAGNDMYHITNTDLSVIGEVSSHNGLEIGPIGLGISIEIGFPKWLVGDTKAYGFDVGLVADNTLLGIGVYVTKKTPINNPLCFSIAPKVAELRKKRSYPILLLIILISLIMLVFLC